VYYPKTFFAHDGHIRYLHNIAASNDQFEDRRANTILPQKGKKRGRHGVRNLLSLNLKRDIESLDYADFKKTKYGSYI